MVTDKPEAYRELLTRHYRRLSLLYDAVELCMPPLRKRIVEVFHGGGPKVLDSACGTGSQLRRLLAAGFHACGTDLSLHMLERARRKTQGARGTLVAQADVAELPFRDSIFDGGLVSLALHEMPFGVAQKGLKELVRVTRKGGLIVVVELSDRPSIVRFLAAPFLRVIEPVYFREYVERGLDAYLRVPGITVRSSFTYFFGLIIVAECVNSKIS